MRDTPEGIVEELREAARIEAMELCVDVDSLTVSEAADHIVYLRAGLARIADGADDPRLVAAETLDPLLWTLTTPE